MKIQRAFQASVVITMLSVPLLGHHSTLAQTGSIRATLEGVITKIQWANPHVTFYMDVRDPETARIVSWLVETGSVKELTALGLDKESLKIGATVTVRGARRPGALKLEVPEPDPSWSKP